MAPFSPFYPVPWGFAVLMSVKYGRMAQMFSKQLDWGAESKTIYFQRLMIHRTEAPPQAS